ncbi:F-box/LRR-repeat protein 2-like [Lytechinus variegatus]|uniref:F-box/LRR-repeat protein 2-like n=1 Tax=Lytechinus variegatus TaxID=7654 RepID=UPI001BB27849|nr:F-box/LRR-repeat protein 2-like [Lytechinus variegatus]
MNSKNLIYVDLQGNERMTGKCFSELNPGCRVVNVMAGWKITNKAIDILASRCTDLEVLNFGYCRRIQMRRLPDMSVDRWVGLNKLTEKCQNLKILHACGSLSVPPDDLMDLKNTQHLQVLCLQGLKQLDDVHLEGIGKSCPALQELNISGTMSMGYAVTGKGLTHLARLPCLAILILGGLLKLTNDGLESLGKRGLLRTLLIRSNTRCDDGVCYQTF